MLLCVAEFMLTVDLSIVNVALPAIDADLGFSASSLQWVVNGYAVTFAGFLLLGGRAADLFGGRRVFLAALALFTTASLACGLSVSAGALVAARVVQGLAAGVLAPATLSILTTTYQETEQRNRALSVWTGVAIGGGAVGGLLGGILTETLSWRAIFFVNVPAGLALLVAATGVLPRGRADKHHARIDLAGALTVTGGLSALVWALVRSEEAGWTSAEVWVGLVVAVVLLSTFIVIETRAAKAPLVPFSVFRNGSLSAGNLLSFLSFVPTMATWFFLSLYLQGLRGYTPIQAGLVFLPVSLAVIAGSQVSFRAISRVDARLLFFIGGLVACIGLGGLALLSPDTSLTWVVVSASIAMTGGGLMFAPITVAATVDLGAESGGLASGLLNTSRQIGGALGLALLGTIAGHSASRAASGGADRAEALSTGYATAFTLGAFVFALTALIGAIALPARLDGDGGRAANTARPTSSGGGNIKGPEGARRSSGTT
ncbi:MULTISPECIES: MFS transporter [unclassified Nocardioides]|uniref:MFS transporter n=1 Tax=unclassified Nocardioides TaxID=2615069 RepID=UPI0009F094D6|nr:MULTISPECIES: MFS transporter [unclassified Nocardioides]GAW48001.1 Drug resistance MFS transporter, drug:H antiporter-2 family [Nocardioides sp. PD653-B2]GAW53696.1 Drug resistance MFS transporter, drug:H antipor ter-2 family [Nocardioides sp. PD653]